MLEFIKNNKLVQFVLVLIAGVAIGALFYPTKTIEERVKKEYEEKIAKQSEEHRKVEQEMTDKLNKTIQEKHSLEIETTKKIASLTIQVRDLQSKTKETYYKIVKPDGTIEIKKFKESEVNEQTIVIASIKEEFNQKVKEIGERYEQVHRERIIKIKEAFDKKESEYKQVIAKMESERKAENNSKKYGLEVGYLSNKNYYSHVNTDVFGPVFVGVHAQSNLLNDYAVGVGIGIRF